MNTLIEACLAIKFSKIKPNKKVEQKFNHYVGICRYVYNVSKELKEEAESQAKQQDLASSDNSADGSGNASDASAAETTSAEDSASVSQEETSHLPSAAFYIIAVFSVLVFVGFLLILITLVRRNKKSGRE